MKYELWYAKSNDAYSFFPEDSTAARKLLEHDATLILEIYADSWDEARTKQHKLLGWSPYIPSRI